MFHKLKPETIARNAARHAEEQKRSHADLIKRLEAEVSKAKTDETRDFYQDMLNEALTREV